MSTIQDILFLRALKEEGIDVEGFSSKHDIPNQTNKGKTYPFVFPKSFLEEIKNLDYSKDYDYFFAGTISGAHREFLLSWDKPKSLILRTSENKFIHPNNDSTNYYKENFFNKRYFQQLASSRFSLTPGGCSMKGDYFRWTYRFWEATLCRSIPITNEPDKVNHLGYKFYRLDDNHVYREDWVKHNFELTKKRHFIWTED